jgi:hypothetical protein
VFNPNADAREFGNGHVERLVAEEWNANEWHSGVDDLIFLKLFYIEMLK